MRWGWDFYWSHAGFVCGILEEDCISVRGALGPNTVVLSLWVLSLPRGHILDVYITVQNGSNGIILCWGHRDTRNGIKRSQH